MEQIGTRISQTLQVGTQAGVTQSYPKAMINPPVPFLTHLCSLTRIPSQISIILRVHFHLPTPASLSIRNQDTTGWTSMMGEHSQRIFRVAATHILADSHSWTDSGKTSMPRSNRKTYISPSHLVKSGSFLLGAYARDLAWPRSMPCYH